jgi:hypothetical protein
MLCRWLCCQRAAPTGARRELDHHLAPGGALYVLMPRMDERRYAAELGRWSSSVAASRWYPLLGRTQLLVLCPR